MGENNNLDRHEEDRKLLEKVRDAYLSMAKENVFAGKSVVINGEKSINEVTADIQKEVSKLV
jgi:thymidylate kinase